MKKRLWQKGVGRRGEKKGGDGNSFQAICCHTNYETIYDWSEVKCPPNHPISTITTQNNNNPYTYNL